MRYVASLIACVVALAAVNVNAAEPGKMNLAAMGLKGLKPMTAEQGMNVRGRGFVLTSGFSFVNIGNVAGGTQNNLAVSLQPNALAVSGSAQIAGVNQQSASSTTTTNYQAFPFIGLVPVSAVNTTTAGAVSTTAYSAGISGGYAR